MRNDMRLAILPVALGFVFALARMPAPDARIPSIQVAVIGDYGSAGQAEASVAAMVDSWSPDLIITTGDNNYPNGESSTIDANIGQYYHGYIGRYQGGYGPGSGTNRFFPSLGNHDWNTSGAGPYLSYFTLPNGSGGERYYHFVWGPVHFFAVDSDPREPNGVAVDSIQGQWLQSRLAASTATWNVVYMHHPPYSSGLHGSTPVLQWPYKDWGADVVLAGHDHHYERLDVAGFPYFVVGTGGSSLYPVLDPLPASKAITYSQFGALQMNADGVELEFRYYHVPGQLFESFTMSKLLPMRVYLPLMSQP